MLYVLKAALVAVRLGMDPSFSHARCLVRSTGSSVGGLSTRYEIQACQPGSTWELPGVSPSLHLVALIPTISRFARFVLAVGMEGGLRRGRTRRSRAWRIRPSGCALANVSYCGTGGKGIRTGQLFRVLKELVARDVRPDELAELGVACAR